MASYVDQETPAELVPSILDMLSASKDNGTLKKGVNETTKSIERKSAKFVVVAANVTPEEIVVHIPMLCKESGIPYAFVPTTKELGSCIGIPKGTTSVAIENPGSAGEKLQDLLKRLPKSGTSKPVPKEEPKKEAKPAPAKEAKKEEKPKEAPKAEEKPKEQAKPKEAPKAEEKPKEQAKPKEAPKAEEKPKEEAKKE